MFTLQALRTAEVRVPGMLGDRSNEGYSDGGGRGGWGYTWGVGGQGQWRVGEGGDGDDSCIGMAEDSAGS